MRVGDTNVLEGATPRSDEAFQRLLLQFSAAAAQGIDAPALIDLFCRATREFFQVDGTYSGGGFRPARWWGWKRMAWGQNPFAASA